MDYGYVTPWVNVLTLSLILVNLLLVSLAWWNFKETRRLIQNATDVIQAFLKGEAATKLLIAIEKVRIAEEVRKEFLGHKHGADGKVQ